MLVLAVITYAMPMITGRKLWNDIVGYWAFWLANIGMVAMTGAFAVAGISQVYLEKKLGLDFLLVQKKNSNSFCGINLSGKFI